VSREAHDLLMSHHFKGNVRELENAIIGALVFAEGDYIRAQDLRRVLQKPVPIERAPDDTLESVLERTERWMIQTALDEAKGIIPCCRGTLGNIPGYALPAAGEVEHPARR
jgi:DNA-binding NtrC family response regulator